MGAYQADGMYEYRDQEMTMSLPSYLRPKKGMRYFAPHRPKARGPGVLSVAVELLREEHRTDAIRRTLIQARDVSWLDVDERVLQKGKPAYLPDGLELLSSSHNSANGDVFHTYHVLFPLCSVYVYVTVFGNGDLDDFTALCRTMVASVRVEDAGMSRD